MFRDYGGITSFHGKMVTVKVLEDKMLVREALETNGQGRVLVEDGEGSTRCALVGNKVARIAQENGWAGIVINGCIRDSDEIASIPVGVKALRAVPRRSAKEGVGEREVSVRFARITFTPGHYLYADQDGIIVSNRDLLASVSRIYVSRSGLPAVSIMVSAARNETIEAPRT